MKKLGILILIFGGLPALSGQFDDPRYERVLIPIVVNGELRGGYGSRWITELVGRNNADQFVRVGRLNPCAITCPREVADPRSDFVYILGTSSVESGGKGMFLYIARPLNEQVKLQFRIQDVSRASMTFGTEIPVVREKDLYTDRLDLLNIPTDQAFRQTLRVYDFDGPSSTVHVRIFPMAGGSTTPLVELSLALETEFGNFNDISPQAQINHLVGAFPQLSAHPRVRIEITPVTPGLRFWGFVTVTNNETQHVTTITPD